MGASGSVRVELRLGAELLHAVTSEPQRDAALLLCLALGRDRAWLLTHREALLTTEQSAAFRALITRRAQHEPMQYIRGEQEFYGLRFRVTPDVLIPRPETELLVECVLARLPHDRPVRIADVGTGSGAIAIALAHSLPLAQVDALDMSQSALHIAGENAVANNVADHVCNLHSDLLAAVRDLRYDAIVSNPPYVSTRETLEPQVADWEPHAALFAGEDGLDVYRRLLPEAAELLLPDGLLALEMGSGQGAALRTLFAADTGWGPVETHNDLRGIPRVALACRASALEVSKG